MYFPSNLTLRRAATAALCIAFAGCLDATAPDPGSDPATETFAVDLGVDLSQMTKVSRVLYTQDIEVGTGTAINLGNLIAVTYVEWLKDATLIASFDEVTPFIFTVGNRNVIDGLNAGVIGMKLGGTRIIVMGSQLAFGKNGLGTVPPQSTLVFRVHLINIQ